MVKLDSFLRECMRITPTGTRECPTTIILSINDGHTTSSPPTEVLSRKVRRPFIFSNGFQAPVGMTISAHLYATHHDESLYPHADEFDGFRFVEAQPSAEKSGKEKGTSVKKTMYTTSPTYLAFGHGRHAWCALITSSSVLMLRTPS